MGQLGQPDQYTANSSQPHRSVSIVVCMNDLMLVELDRRQDG